MRMGRVNEVVTLTDYMIRAKGNGVNARYLTELEDSNFKDVAMEDRVMTKFALSSELARAEGKAEGLAEGKAEGEAKGSIAARHEIAKRMLETEMPDEDIHRLTKLTIEELAALKKSLK